MESKNEKAVLQCCNARDPEKGLGLSGSPDVHAAATDVPRHVLRDPGVGGPLRPRNACELAVGDADHDLYAAAGERAQHTRVGVEELDLADPVRVHQVHHHARRRAVGRDGAPVHPDRRVGPPRGAEGPQEDGGKQRGGSGGHCRGPQSAIFGGLGDCSWMKMGYLGNWGEIGELVGQPRRG